MDVISRAKNIIVSPKTEWPAIAVEPSDIPSLYTGYVVLLAAIPPIAGLIGHSLLFARFGVGLGIVGAIVAYVLSLIAVYVMAWIAAKLAPMFGGRDDINDGMKLIAYGTTASWVGGIFRIIPFLGILSLLASLYTLYLYYTGASTIMGVPQDRVVGYIIALIVAAIVVFVIAGAIVRAVVGTGMMM